MMSKAWPVRDFVPMPRRTPNPHLLRHRRTALVAGAVVILALAGFAVWAARQNQASVDRVRTLTTVSDAYQQARHAVAQEDIAARGYRLEPDHVQIDAFDRAEASLFAARELTPEPRWVSMHASAIAVAGSASARAARVSVRSFFMGVRRSGGWIDI